MTTTGQSSQDAAAARQTAVDVRQAQADAKAAANDARAAATQAAREANPGMSISTTVGPEGVTKTITYPDGRGGTSTIVIDRNGVQIGGPKSTSSSSDAGPSRDIPPGALEISKDFLTAACVIAIGLPLARAVGRWLDRRTAAPRAQPEVAQRLAAIEQAVDSIAVEVERVTEGQRFAAKLLSERQHAPAPEFLPARAITPIERARG